MFNCEIVGYLCNYNNLEKMAAACNVPAKLCLDGNLSSNWKAFEQSFTIYLLASGLNETSEERKIALLLNLIGEEALIVYNTIRDDDKDKKLQDVLDRFKDYCNPKKNILHSRFLFYERKQKEGEDFASFFTQVKVLIQDCEFTNVDEMLRDKLVFGSNNDDIKSKLIKEGNPKLNDVVQTLRLADISSKQVEQILSRPNLEIVHSSNVHVKNMNYQQTHDNGKNLINCNRCGYNHARGRCPAYNKTCAKCQGKNHFAKMCKTTRPSDRQRKVHSIDTQEDDENTDYFCGLLNISSIQSKAYSG